MKAFITAYFFWLIIFLAIVFIISYNAAKAFEHIADEKGYDGSRYFWWIFLLGAVGWAMVIALPDKNARPNYAQVSAKAQSDDEIPEI